MAQKKKKDYKRSTYTDALDDVFSHYLRQKYADDDGYVLCYTCDASLHWKDIQCGHYYKRKASSTRWEEKNCRPQCYSCNVGRDGNYPVYGTRIAREIGVDAMEELDRLNHTELKLHNFELLDMIKHYYSLLKWPDEISKTLEKRLKQLKVI